MQNQPYPAEGPLCAFYQHIVDLPLNKFIEVSTTGNLSALIISGQPTEEQIHNAWGTIMEEYSFAIGDHETRLRFNLYTEINKLQLKIDQIALIVSILRNFYVERFVTELNNLLVTTMKFDVNNREDYDRKLKLALNRSKGFKIQLDLNIMQYNALLKEGGETSIGKEYFQTILITISNHAKYMIPDTITVFEFCERIKRFNREMEIKNK
jgi:hypothetical protein